VSINYTPRTWVAGEVVTAAFMNTEVRDALTGVQSAWTAFTPTWTAATVNPVLGNGSFSGSAFQRYGKTILFRIVLTMGTTTTFGTGQWILTPPVAAVAPNTNRIGFVADAYDNGLNAYAAWATFFTAGSLYLYCDPTVAAGAARALGTGVPFSWGSADQLVINGVGYEAA
jgi:hypothetical protein